MATIAKHEMLANDLLLNRLFADVNVLDSESCWLWNKSVVKDGYGKMRRIINGKQHAIFVHRLSWFSQYGEIPDGMVVDHTCHNPSECISGTTCKHRRCINPNHMKLTSMEDNVAKGASVRANVGLCKNNLHEWTETNIKVWRSGKAVCLPCHQATTRRNAKKVKNG